MRFWLLTLLFGLGACNLINPTDIEIDGPLAVGDWKSSGQGAAFWPPNENNDPEILLFNCSLKDSSIRFTTSGKTKEDMRDIATKKVKMSLKIKTENGILKTDMVGGHAKLPSVLLSPSDPALTALFEAKGRFAIMVADKHKYQLPITPILSEALTACKN